MLGLTFIVAVIINYIKKDYVKGTWLESHFRWQLRTFWFSVLWLVIGIIAAFFVIGYFVLIANKCLTIKIHTDSKKRLEVHAWLDKNQYEKAKKISDDRLAEVQIKRNTFHGEWNYQIRSIE